MKILVSGASGLVGKALVPGLLAAGHDVRALSRSGSNKGGIGWNVQTGALDRTALDRWRGPEGIIHLAGENIAARRWTAKQKRRIRDSRVAATDRLVANLLPFTEKARKLRVFVGASAVGYYGNRGDEILTESSVRGTGFLADVAGAWESAAGPLIEAGVRVAHLRFGMILSREGGALPKMLPIFRFGFGGKVGSGEQWLSWISIEDVVRAIEFALTEKNVAGPYNAVAPQPVRNAEFTKALASALHRRALRVPAFVPRLLLGEMGEALLLASQRVLPERLEAAGFRCAHPEISGALRQALYKI